MSKLLFIDNQINLSLLNLTNTLMQEFNQIIVPEWSWIA